MQWVLARYKIQTQLTNLRRHFQQVIKWNCFFFSLSMSEVNGRNIINIIISQNDMSFGLEWVLINHLLNCKDILPFPLPHRRDAYTNIISFWFNFVIRNDYPRQRIRLYYHDNQMSFVSVKMRSTHIYLNDSHLCGYITS